MTAKILIVDDTKTMRVYEATLLKKLGYETFQASEAFEALSMLSIKNPDIVLLDIEMPGMDGIECCRKIKSDENFSNIKVIMVSTLTQYTKIRAAFKAGADDYITKPINPKELETKVKDLLKFSELRKVLKDNC